MATLILPDPSPDVTDAVEDLGQVTPAERLFDVLFTAPHGLGPDA
ncbi:hypothetical protein [Kineosporia corallincola]|nr:hypothetical protein [Kineosporia corallincola]